MADETKPGGSANPFSGATWGQTQDCLMCPFGLMFFTLRNTRPEVVEHLMKAGMEMMLAFKSVLDAAAERFGHTEDGSDGLQRITIE
ncbi:MAG: hypothetical protein ACRDJM_07135 [Actinomycetota bacterium]